MDAEGKRKAVEVLRLGRGRVRSRAASWLLFAAALWWPAACRIERIESRADGAAADSEPPLPSPPRYAADEAPFSPLHSLFQGAFGPEGEGARPPPLPGWQILVTAPDPELSSRVSRGLCEALRGNKPPLVALREAMAQLECALPADLTSRREALVESAWGAWGAAVAVPPALSAASAADVALRNQLGLVVGGGPGGAVRASPGPLADPGEDAAVLHCPGVPPVALAVTEAPSPEAAAAASISDPAGGGRAIADAGAAAARTDGGAPVAAAMPDAGPGVPARPAPGLVFAGLRTPPGAMFGAVAGVAPADAGRGAAGQIALPSRRLVVGERGIVVVDPALRDRTLPPRAAYHAYGSLVEGRPPAGGMLALVPEGPVGVAGSYVRYLHVASDAPAGACREGQR